jgi:Zn-dependent metalloprotease
MSKNTRTIFDELTGPQNFVEKRKKRTPVCTQKPNDNFFVDSVAQKMLVVLLLLLHRLSQGSGEVLQKLRSSRVSSGLSSHLHFEPGLRSHLDNLNSFRIPPNKDRRKSVLQSFWNQHSSYFGVLSEEMSLTKELHDHGASLTNYHYQQTLHGYEVYGGVIVVTIGSSDEPVSARGHGLPADLIDVDLLQQINIDGSNAVNFVQRHINRLHEHDAALEATYVCTESSVKLLWYRNDIVRGGQGRVSLSYLISGSCQRTTDVNTKSPPEQEHFISFDAFVNSANGVVEKYIDKTTQFTPHLHRSDPLEITTKTRTQNKVERTHTRDTQPLVFASHLNVQIYLALENACCSGAHLSSNLDPSLPSDTEEYNAIVNTVEITTMMKSLSGGSYESINGGQSVLNVAVRADMFNAYYFNSSIVLGEGLSVDDVIAHEWGHGYTEFTSGLIYSHQSGAINEAMSDIFGESVDLLNEETPKLLRSTNQTCTAGPWVYASTPGQDNTTRWIVGDSIYYQGSYGWGLRDMYAPECFNHPSHTQSLLYYCGTLDDGGVHTNSAVINRIFALLVDGGNTNSTVVTGIGLTKALNLMWAMNLALFPSSQFSDFGTILSDTCLMKIGSQLYLPSLSSGQYTLYLNSFFF